MSITTLLLLITLVALVGWLLYSERSGIGDENENTQVEDSGLQVEQIDRTRERADDISQNKKKKIYLFISVLFLVVLMWQGFYLFQVDPQTIIFTIPSAVASEVRVTYDMFRWVFLVFAILYLWRSFVTLYPDELATLLLFGRELFSIGSGLFPVWLGFCNLVYGPKKRQQREFPADFNKIWFGSTETKPEGMVEPFRIPTGGVDNLTENQSPLEGRLTLDVAFFTAFRFKNLTLAAGVLGITDEHDVNNFPTGRLTVDVEEGFRQIQDTAKRVLQTLFGEHNPKWIIENQGQIAVELAKELDKLVRYGEYRWGIDLEEVALTLVGLSHSLNSTIRDASQAQYLAQIAIAAGRGEATVVFLKGEQAAIVKRLQLQAEATGLEALAKSLGLENNIPALTALVNAKLAETGLQAIGEGGGKIVLIGGGGAGAVQNILGLVEGLRGENV